jgi:ribonuclease P protein component
VLHRPIQQDQARLGIIIAKQHVKKAVDRNAIRRVIRESFRHHKDRLKGLDIIVLLRSECTPLGDKKALRDNVDHLWQLVSSYKPV